MQSSVYCVYPDCVYTQLGYTQRKHKINNVKNFEKLLKKWWHFCIIENVNTSDIEDVVEECENDDASR